MNALCVYAETYSFSVMYVFFSFVCVDNQTGLHHLSKIYLMKIIFKTYLILMIIIVYQVAKMMERTQTLPDRIDRNVQE